MWSRLILPTLYHDISWQWVPEALNMQSCCWWFQYVPMPKMTTTARICLPCKPTRLIMCQTVKLPQGSPQSLGTLFSPTCLIAANWPGSGRLTSSKASIATAVATRRANPGRRSGSETSGARTWWGSANDWFLDVTGDWLIRHSKARLWRKVASCKL